MHAGKENQPCNFHLIWATRKELPRILELPLYFVLSAIKDKNERKYTSEDEVVSCCAFSKSTTQTEKKKGLTERSSGLAALEQGS